MQASTHYDFFVSYNRADRTWAEWIAWQLEEAGYTVVIQAWDFRPGSNFVVDMQQAASAARRTIAVLSPDYMAARFTQPEWTAAFAQDPTGTQGTLLPVRVRAVDLSGLLPQIIYIDLVGLEEATAQATLLAGVQRSRAKPTVAPTFPASTLHRKEDQPEFPHPAPGEHTDKVGTQPMGQTGDKGLLTSDERRQLIDLLRKLPNIHDPQALTLLLATLPPALRDSIPRTRVVAMDIPRLVDTVEGEAWSPLPDGVYPITVVIENASGLAPGSRLASELQALLTTLRSRTAGSAYAPPPTQGLSGQQRRAIQQALLSAYGVKGALEQMVSFCLNEKLAVIAGGDNLSEIIFSLIQWAEASGKVTDLLRCARQENPGNPELQMVAQQFGEE
jgi:hypothetical protein